MELPISRRKLLKGAGSIAAFSALSTTFLSNCQKSCRNEEASVNAKEEDSHAAFCEGADLVSEDQKAIRAALRYVDTTARRAQTCDNCKLYTRSAPETLCGGCKVVPGPIHPKGWCSSWYALM